MSVFGEQIERIQDDLGKYGLAACQACLALPANLIGVKIGYLLHHELRSPAKFIFPALLTLRPEAARGRGSPVAHSVTASVLGDRPSPQRTLLCASTFVLDSGVCWLWGSPLASAHMADGSPDSDGTEKALDHGIMKNLEGRYEADLMRSLPGRAGAMLLPPLSRLMHCHRDQGGLDLSLTGNEVPESAACWHPPFPSRCPARQRTPHPLGF
jgi:hypothetical protein